MRPSLFISVSSLFSIVYHSVWCSFFLFFPFFLVLTLLQRWLTDLCTRQCGYFPILVFHIFSLSLFESLFPDIYPLKIYHFRYILRISTLFLCGSRACAMDWGFFFFFFYFFFSGVYFLLFTFYFLFFTFSSFFLLFPFLLC